MLYNYVNSFQCTTPKDRSAIYIALSQVAPALGLENEEIHIKHERVLDFFMDADDAREFAESIMDLLDEDDQ